MCPAGSQSVLQYSPKYRWSSFWPADISPQEQRNPGAQVKFTLPVWALVRALISPAGGSIPLTSSHQPSPTVLPPPYPSFHCHTCRDSSVQQLKQLMTSTGPENLKKHSLIPSTEDTPVVCGPQSQSHLRTRSPDHPPLTSPPIHLLETPQAFKTPNDDSLNKKL